MIFYAALALGAVPLLVLLWHRQRGRVCDPSYWWLAGAFAVSLASDMLGAFGLPVVASRVYPLTQAALSGAVFLVRRDALVLLAVLTACGVFAFANPLPNDDVFFRVVAFGAVVGIVIDRPELGALRTSLLVYFGAGLVAWLAYVVVPGWPSWLLYQSTRVAGIALFCHAVDCQAPVLRVMRKAA